MDNTVHGAIFSGSLDLETHEFVLTEVKEMSTQTVLNRKQLDAIYNYLAKAVNQDEYHVLTLYDQLPVRLSNDEVAKLLIDLTDIKAMLEG
jgi:hypothetical protein